MAGKSIRLEGFGIVMLNSIAIKEREYEVVDLTGNSLKRKVIGERAKTVYETSEGIQIPGNQICKKISIDGEDIVAPKFQPTKEIPKNNIVTVENNGLIYSALERKFYNAVTDNEKLKDLIIAQHKSLEFPIVMGLGWKIWKGILTNWNNKLLLVACRGNLQKELEKYSEDTVELEMDIAPKQDMKKLVKMAMI